MSTEAVETEQPQREPRIFYGWWIVVVGFLSELIQGASVYTFPVFYKPMAEALNWSRTTVAWAPTLRTFVSASISPWVGRWVDHRGPKGIMVVGALLMGATSVAMAGIGEVWHYLLVYSLLGSFAFVTRGPLVTIVTISKWFIRRRGRAIAFVTMGVSLAGVIFTPLGAFVIDAYGWRTAWVLLGILTWIVLIPSSLFMRRQPEDIGLLPDGLKPAPSQNAYPADITASHEEGQPTQALEDVWTLRQALRAPSFWLILIAFNLGGMAINSVLIHQFNYITDKGFSIAVAASVVTVYAFFAIIAKLIYGFASERVHIRYLVIVSFTGGGIAISILNFADSVTALYIYAITYGLTRGAFLLVTPLTWANYFGRTFQGTIRGVATPFNMFAGAFGPLFAAWVYDTQGDYELAFTVFSITFLLGAFFIFLAKPTKPPTSTPSQSPDHPPPTFAVRQG